MSAVFLVLFLVPAAALCWRVIVSKSRNNMLKVGGAAAAMITIVGAAVAYDNLQQFNFHDWRNDLALAAAVSGSVYLLIWAQRHRTNLRHRTISLIAAIIGLVPFVATVATTLVFGRQQ